MDFSPTEAAPGRGRDSALAFSVSLFKSNQESCGKMMLAPDSLIHFHANMLNSYVGCSQTVCLRRGGDGDAAAAGQTRPKL